MKIDLLPAQCEDILAANHYAHLGCTDDGEPYVIPITYVYSGGFVYGFTQEGRKVDMLRKNPKMCVQVEHVESGEAWESVICWGLFEEVTDDKSIQDIKLLFAQQHGESILSNGTTLVSPAIDDVSRLSDVKTNDMVAYRMKPYRMTGKAEKA